MTTTYANSLSYLAIQNALDADKLGYVNSTLVGESFMGLFPIVPTSHFMREEYMEKKPGAKTTTKRALSTEPDPSKVAQFAKKVETTTLYYDSCQIDKKVAARYPERYDSMLLQKGQEIVQNIDYDIIRGVPDDTGLGLNGLANRIGVTDAKWAVNNSATLTIDTDASTFKQFLKLFRKAVRKIKRAPGMRIAAFMNERTELAIQAGRDVLGASVIGSSVFDILNQTVTTIEGIPLLITRGDSAENEIIGFDENAESSTSIWIVGFGGGVTPDAHLIPQGVNILTGDSLVQFDDAQTVKTVTTGIDYEVGLRVPDASVVRFSRLKVA